MTRPTIFFDRDGVINDVILKDLKPHPPRSLHELKLMPDVYHVMNHLKELGYRLIVVTNQPDVSRGLISKAAVNAINGYIMSKLPLDEIRVCYHDDNDNCQCRKPKPGLILQAADDYSISLSHSYMVGDRWKDIEAGRLAGCKTIWIENVYHENKPKLMDFTISNLLELLEIIKN